MGRDNYTWVGNLVLEEQVERTVDFNEWGVAKATEVFFGPWADCIIEGSRLDSHTEFPWLRKKTAQAKREEGNSGKLSVSYEGVPPETNIKQYSCKADTASEPIQTHPNFPSFGVAANGAIFESDGSFKGFTPLINGAENTFGGMESWLVPGLIYEEVWIIGKSKAEYNYLDNIGKVDRPPKSPVLPPDNGRNWILATADLELIGDGCKVVRRWKRSGPRGWNAVVYDY